MTAIGFYEARTHLSELLDQVRDGKRFLITKRGKPAALLVPPPAQNEKDVRQVVKDMLEHRDREGPTLGSKLTVRDLIEEGRQL
jgi:prevent-host-death family protein